MKKIIPILFCIVLAGILIAGCDGMFGDIDGIRKEAEEKNGEKINQNIEVTVNPPSAELARGQQQQFSALVEGTENSGVTWSVSGGDGSSTIDADGLLTVGNTEVTEAVLTIKATSVVNKSRSGIALVTVTDLVNAVVPTISVHPQSGTPNIGGSLTLSVTATVTDGGNRTYQWYSSTVSPGNPPSGGTLITGATNNTYAPGTAVAGTTYYYVIVTNTNNSVNGTKTATATSNAATINVRSIVTFDSNGGSTVSPQYINLGGTATRPTSNPTRSGYNFDNWYSDTSLTILYNFSSLVNANTTIYAKWLAYCDVKFDANGGTGTMANKRYVDGNALSALTANDFSRRGYTFDSWTTASNGSGTSYNDQQGLRYSDILGAAPGATITLYAKWNREPFPAIPTSGSLDSVFEWFADYALTGETYNIALTSDLTLSPKALVAGTGYENYTINLSGTGAERILSLSSAGSMFIIYSGVTLILGNNITLQGRSANSGGGGSLVMVNSGGTLQMNAGSKITDNKNTARLPYGGGVYVSAGGSFTMAGGEISDNSVTASISAGYGGGVYVNGSFTMTGGTITNNSATHNGGGVYINTSGAFSKTGSSTITGYSSDGVNGNRVARGSPFLTPQSNSGHAVFAYSSAASPKRKEYTAGTGTGGNLAYNGTVSPTTFSGAWDN